MTQMGGSQLPHLIREQAIRRGVPGIRWLEQLEDQLRALEEKWQIAPNRIVEGATEALVVQVQTRNLTADRFAPTSNPSAPNPDFSRSGDLTSPAAGPMITLQTYLLKLALPPRDPLPEVYTQISSWPEHDVLSTGCGAYVQVIARDHARRALLLEWLGPPLQGENRPIRQKLEIICDLLRWAWEVSLTHLRLRDQVQQAHALARQIQRDAGIARSCQPATIARALMYCQQRAAAFQPDSAIVAHGDAHAWNTLKVSGGDPDEYRFIDPEPIIAEPAYDLGVLMREWSVECLADDPLAHGQERARFLSERSGQPVESIWQWGIIQRVSNGLLCLQSAPLREEGIRALAVADAWCSVGP